MVFAVSVSADDADLSGGVLRRAMVVAALGLLDNPQAVLR